MTMNTKTILVSLVGYDHAIEVNPNDHDLHIMRVAVAVSKTGAILIKRYATKCRKPIAGKLTATDLSRNEFYRYIRASMPIIATYVADANATKIRIIHEGFDLDGVPYSAELTIERLMNTHDAGELRSKPQDKE